MRYNLLIGFLLVVGAGLIGISGVKLLKTGASRRNPAEASTGEKSVAPATTVAPNAEISHPSTDDSKPNEVLPGGSSCETLPCPPKEGASEPRVELAGTEIAFHADTAIKYKNTISGIVAAADYLNSGIENGHAYVDRGKGQLSIGFDYPKSNWFFTDSHGKNLFPIPMKFLIRLFDKNGQILTYFLTSETFFPQYPYEVVHPKSSTCIPITFKANKLTYPINAIVASHVQSVEFGFNTDLPIKETNVFSMYTGPKKSGYCRYKEKEFKMGAGVGEANYECTFSSNDPRALVFSGDEVSVRKLVLCNKSEFMENTKMCCIRNRSGSEQLSDFSNSRTVKKEPTTGECTCDDASKLPFTKGDSLDTVECLAKTECFFKNKIVQIWKEPAFNENGNWEQADRGNNFGTTSAECSCQSSSKLVIVSGKVRCKMPGGMFGN